ncbi:Hypothetical protein A7982_03507 [Minicystis rosea]|nr:Hypothetical protein A7982_03507 [Minicystis rosea]
MKKNVVLVLAGLALGLGAGVLVVPRGVAIASPPAAPTKWQQFCEPASSIPEASSIAGARGTEGWELVTYTAGVLCFKRPAQPKSGDANWPGY